MVGTARGDCAWGGEMSFGKGVHLMFGFGSPLGVGFDGAKDANVVLVNKAARMDPFAPVLVSIYSACILKSETECGGLGVAWDWCHGVAPGVGGDGVSSCGSGRLGWV